MWTGDERVFFYNPTTRLSMWDRPDELQGRTDVDKHIQEPPHKRGPDDARRPGEPHARATGLLRAAFGNRAPACLVFSKEEPDVSPDADDAHDEEPSKAKKRKSVARLPSLPGVGALTVSRRAGRTTPSRPTRRRRR